jgi:hypothetical protein
MEKLANNIDFKLLNKQKFTLVKLTQSPLLTDGEKDDLLGILNLVDAVQDRIVDSNTKTEEEVFPDFNTTE